MSFIGTSGGADRGIGLVMQSLLQDEVLPFSDGLTTEHISQAFAAEGVSFGNAPSNGAEEAESDGGIVYTMDVTLWAMISQAMMTDVQRACRAAVQRVASYYALSGVKISSTNTGAYCRARAKVPAGVVEKRPHCDLGQASKAAMARPRNLRSPSGSTPDP